MLGSYQEGQKGGHKMLLSSHFLKLSTLAPKPGNPVGELAVQSHALIQSFMQIMFVGLSTVLHWVHVAQHSVNASLHVTVACCQHSLDGVHGACHPPHQAAFTVGCACHEHLQTHMC